MAKKMQGHHVDGYLELNFAAADDSIFVTVQAVPFGENTVSTTWWVSGLGELWMPRLLMKLELTIPFTSDSQFETACKEIAASDVERLARLSAAAGGMVSPSPENAPEVSEELAKVHFTHHMNQPRFSVSTESMSTGTLYLMAKAFGVKNPIRFVSTFQNVSSTTVTKRLTRYRDSGFIPKSRLS
jgi:hypothetical protein